MAKKKKAVSLKKEIITASVCTALSAAMIVGTAVAYQYNYILDVFFQKSDYVATDGEKQLCEEVVNEGVTLLKNEDNYLPVKTPVSDTTVTKKPKVAFLGQDSVDFVYGGAGCGSVDTSSAPTLKSAFEKAGFEVDSTVWNFYDTGAGKSYRKSVPTAQGSGNFEVNEVPASVYTDEVKNSLSNDDVIICCIGRSGGESFDLPTTKTADKYKQTGGDYLYLQVDDNERAMLKLACEKSDNVVLLVNSNNAMELGFLDEAEYNNIKSVLWVPGVGQEGLYAVGNIVSGKVNPSGSLVDTWAYDSTSAPSYQNLGNYQFTGVTFDQSDYESKYNKVAGYISYNEGIYVGYKYYETRYEDFALGTANTGTYDYSKSVQFPFGYGLSYTTFSYSDFSVTESTDSFKVSVKVTNTGDVAGKDTVQVYAQSEYTNYDVTNGIEKAAVELVGYQKTGTIESKASETVEITVDKSALATYDSKTAKTYIMDAGQYYLTCATDAHNAVNNILAKKAEKNSAISGRMSGTGAATLVYDGFAPATTDATTYSVSKATGNKITNQFDDVDVNYYEAGSLTYLTRNDWTGTFPTTYKNGTWAVTEAENKALAWNRSDEVVTASSTDVMPTMDANTNYTIADAKNADGTLKDYDDEIWTKLAQQVSKKKTLELVRCGGYQTIAVSTINLPATIDKDGPSGVSGTLVGGTSCMAWPVEVMMSATWNDELIEKMGKYIGDDSIAAGVTGWYAPGADIHRSPYSGRNFEYYSEDGFLSGKIGAAEIRGVRSRGVIAYMKHFALNDQETARGSGSVFANEQSIREIYLKGFEYMVTEGGCTAAMASMNRVGMTWSGAHKGLMTNVLRDEWGFKGMVITDQASVSAMFYEDIISGLYAGTDMWLNTSGSFWNLDDFYAGATSNPKIMSYVQRSAKNIIYAVTSSNAAQTYDQSDTTSTTTSKSGSTVFPWRTLLWIVDGIIWAGSLALVSLTTVGYIKGKKQGEVTEADK